MTWRDFSQSHARTEDKESALCLRRHCVSEIQQPKSLRRLLP